jgi:peptidoglycan/LPS O-acetylase OafA/YrhL
MAPVSGYPALVLGLLAGLLVLRSRGPAAPVLVAGALAFAALVAYQASGSVVASPEGNGVMTTPLWIGLALVNAGAWALGIGMAVALTGRRAPR